MNCFVCKKKLTLVEQSIGNCKCGHIFCNKHRRITTPEDKQLGNYHICSYDYKIENKKNIAINNPYIRNPQLLDI